MMGRWLALPLGLGLLAGCRHPPPPPPPAAPPPTIRDEGGIGARALGRMKDLTGNWNAGELPISFESIEFGRVVAQRGGFYIVWHADGNSLAASVFAPEGYHVRMRSTKVTDTPDGALTVQLETLDAGNITPDEPIARSLAMTIAPGNDRVTQRWMFGKDLDTPPREIVMTRADAGAPAAPKPPTPTSPAPPTPTSPAPPTPIPPTPATPGG
jgi:hypothetical protein